MKTIVATFIVVAVTATVKEQGQDVLYPLSLEVGQKGRFLGYGKAIMRGEEYWTEVEEVLSDKEVLVKVGRMEPTGPKGLLRPGPVKTRIILLIETKGLADGKAMNLKGLWEVTDTRKIEKRTHMVVKYLGE